METESADSSLILYQTEDGQTRLEVTLLDGTVWLTQGQMSELFGKDRRTISEHIQNVFTEGELRAESTIRKFRTVRREGVREVGRQVDHYNLDVIISVGYRVRSHRGTQFRIWATSKLREFIAKGFVLDDQRLKNLGGGQYFDELLARIRDIRSSEKVFWRKVLDIYATSVDYDAQTETSKTFFATLQNKMHWAVHGRTAAEIIYARADANKTNMGLTSWPGMRMRKADVEVAKNYLNADELNILNRLVSMYLDFAELQALNREPMYMKDWVHKLNHFLQMTSRDVLSRTGTVSHDVAVTRAREQYVKFQEQRALDALSPVEQHFLEAVKEIERLDTDT